MADMRKLRSTLAAQYSGGLACATTCGGHSHPQPPQTMHKLTAHRDQTTHPDVTVQPVLLH